MFACERCGRAMDVEETSTNPDPGRCRRERQCPACAYVCKTTETSDAAYKAAVRKSAIVLAREMVRDIRAVLGKTGTGKKKPHR